MTKTIYNSKLLVGLWFVTSLAHAELIDRRSPPPVSQAKPQPADAPKTASQAPLGPVVITTTPPSTAAEPPPPPIPNWVVEPESSARKTLEAWAKEAGMTVRWEYYGLDGKIADFTMHAHAEYRGTFVKAVGEWVASMSAITDLYIDITPAPNNLVYVTNGGQR